MRASTSKPNSIHFGRRITALFLLITFGLSNNSTGIPLAHAEGMHAVQDPQSPQADGLESLGLPPDLGTVDENYKGSDPHSVIVIQDAHAIGDAQKSILRLLEFLNRNFSLGVVGVEGAAGPLDPTLFRAFPKTEVLNKVFEDYLNRGELSGAAAASVLIPKQIPYLGIEDPALYEKGIDLFLSALDKQPDFLNRIESLNSRLRDLKKKTYSPELLKLDGELEQFESRPSGILDLLKDLRTFASPKLEAPFEKKYPHLAALLAEETGRKNTADFDVEIKNAVKKIKPALKAGVEIQAFEAKLQDYQTERISGEVFARELARSAKEKNIPVKFSGGLEQGILRQNMLSEMKGTQFFKEFQDCAKTAKQALLGSEEEKSVDALNGQLEILEKLVRLKLTRQEWESLGRELPEKENPRTKDFKEALQVLQADLLKNKNEFFDFYKNAEQREAALFERLSKSWDKGPAKISVVVVGGFHRDGFGEILKQKNISYALLSPAIRQMPQGEPYLDYMKGEVSWKSYFEPKDGQVDLYDAFSRATTDRLLEGLGSDPEAGLRNWRDQVIRNLAAEQKVAAAGEYTRFIDSAGLKLAAPEKREKMTEEWRGRVSRFIADLKALHDQKKLTPENVMRLAQTPSIPTWNSAGPMVRGFKAPKRWFGPRGGFEEKTKPARSVSVKQSRQLAGQRSEMRALPVPSAVELQKSFLEALRDPAHGLSADLRQFAEGMDFRFAEAQIAAKLREAVTSGRYSESWFRAMAEEEIHASNSNYSESERANFITLPAVGILTEQIANPLWEKTGEPGLRSEMRLPQSMRERLTQLRQAVDDQLPQASNDAERKMLESFYKAAEGLADRWTRGTPGADRKKFRVLFKNFADLSKDFLAENTAKVIYYKLEISPAGENLRGMLNMWAVGIGTQPAASYLRTIFTQLNNLYVDAVPGLNAFLERPERITPDQKEIIRQAAQLIQTSQWTADHPEAFRETTIPIQELIPWTPLDVALAIVWSDITRRIGEKRENILNSVALAGPHSQINNDWRGSGLFDVEISLEDTEMFLNRAFFLVNVLTHAGPDEQAKSIVEQDLLNADEVIRRAQDALSPLTAPAEEVAALKRWAVEMEILLNSTREKYGAVNRSEMRQNFIEQNHLDHVANSTVFSLQMEAAVPGNLMARLRKKFGDKVADDVAQAAMTGGLGALMHDLFPSWKANGTDVVAILPIWEEIKQFPKQQLGLGKYLREVILDEMAENAAEAIPPFSVELNITDRFRNYARTTNSKAQQVFGKKIFVRPLLSKTEHYQAPTYYLDAYYLADETRPDEESNRVRIFEEIYSDDNAWRDIHMAIYSQGSEKLMEILQDRGIAKQNIAEIHNEVFVSLPKLGRNRETTKRIHINHSAYLPTMYSPSEDSFELFGFPEWQRSSLVHAKYGKNVISIVDFVANDYNRITSVSLDEHLGVLERNIFPNSANKLLGYYDGEIRNTNGVLVEFWQSPERQQLVRQYRQKLGLGEEATDHQFYDAMNLPAHEALRLEFQKRDEMIKASDTIEFLIWLAEKQGNPLWLNQVLQTLGFTTTKALRGFQTKVGNALEANDDAGWETLIDSRAGAVRDAVLAVPMVSNVRRQVPYKGPEKWLEVMLKKPLMEVFKRLGKNETLRILWQFVPDPTLNSDNDERREAFKRALEVLKNNQGEWWKEIDNIFQLFPALPVRIMLLPGYQNVRDELAKGTEAVEIFKKNAGRAVLGGRNFGPDAYDAFAAMKAAIKILGLENHFATVENYNSGEAPIIFRAMTGVVMLSDEFLEASATSMEKGLVNGAILVGVWGGADPELFTIMDSSGNPVNIFERKVTHDEVVSKLEQGAWRLSEPVPGASWRIINGHLVKYSGDLSIQAGGGRRPSAQSLEDGLFWMSRMAQTPEDRRAMQWGALSSSWKVNMREGQARAHLMMLEDMLAEGESKDKIFSDLEFSMADLKKLFLEDKTRFTWRTGEQMLRESRSGLLGFIDSYRKIRTWGDGAKRGKQARNAVLHHAAKSATDGGDIFNYILNLSAFSGVSPQLAPFKARIEELARQARATPDETQKVRLNVEALELMDRLMVWLSGHLVDQYLAAEGTPQALEMQKFFEDPRVRRSVARYLDQSPAAGNLSTTEKGIRAYAVEREGKKRMLVLNIRAVSYPDAKDGNIRKAWARVAYSPAFEGLLEKAATPGEIFMHQVHDVNNGKAFKIYDLSELQSEGLSVGVPDPGIQLLEFEPKPVKLVSLLSSAVQRPAARETTLHLQAFLKEIQTAVEEQKDIKAFLSEIAALDAPAAAHLFTPERVPAIMALLAVLAPDLLDSIQAWNPEAHAALNKTISENEELFTQGEINFHQASRDSTVVFSRTLGDKNAVAVLQFVADPVSPQDGKVWSNVGRLGSEEQNEGLRLKRDTEYVVQDLLNGYTYSRHWGQDLLEEGWRVGTPVRDSKLGDRIVQKGWGFQILSLAEPLPRRRELAPDEAAAYKEPNDLQVLSINTRAFLKKPGVDYQDAFTPDELQAISERNFGKFLEANRRAFPEKPQKGFRRFDEITLEELQALKASGVETLWTVGAWQESEYSWRLNRYWGKIEDPVPGRVASAFAIPDYLANPAMGGEEAFKVFVKNAEAAGLRVVVDAIPNHLAKDSPLIKEHPDWFIHRTDPPPDNQRDFYFEVEIQDGGRAKKIWVAHGKDGTPWADTAQLDLLNPDVWGFLKDRFLKMAELTKGGGIRLDSLQVLLPSRYREIWVPQMSQQSFDAQMRQIALLVFGRFPEETGNNLFELLIDDVKDKYPDFKFIGEIYLGQQEAWRQAGVDLVYVKDLFDWLVPQETGGQWQRFKDYVLERGNDAKPLDYRFHSLFFLENHDERKRVLNELSKRLHKPVDTEILHWSMLLAAALATTPGVFMLYEGQMQGHSRIISSANYIPSQAALAEETYFPELEQFYKDILNLTMQPVFRRGSAPVRIPLLDTPGGEKPQVLAFMREYEGKAAIVVLNHSREQMDLRLDLAAVGLGNQPLEFKAFQAWGTHVEVRDKPAAPAGEKRSEMRTLAAFLETPGIESAGFDSPLDQAAWKTFITYLKAAAKDYETDQNEETLSRKLSAGKSVLKFISEEIQRAPGDYSEKSAKYENFGKVEWKISELAAIPKTISEHQEALVLIASMLSSMTALLALNPANAEAVSEIEKIVTGLSEMGSKASPTLEDVKALGPMMAQFSDWLKKKMVVRDEKAKELGALMKYDGFYGISQNLYELQTLLAKASPEISYEKLRAEWNDIANKREDGGPLLTGLQTHPDVLHMLGIGDKYVREELFGAIPADFYKGKDVLVVPVVGNVLKTFKDLGAKSVTAVDKSQRVVDLQNDVLNYSWDSEVAAYLNNHERLPAEGPKTLRGLPTDRLLRLKGGKAEAKPLEGIQVLQGDLFKGMPLKDSSVDFVFVPYVMGVPQGISAEYYKAVFSELFRVLRPGGTIAVLPAAVSGFGFALPGVSNAASIEEAKRQIATLDEFFSKIGGEFKDQGFQIEPVSYGSEFKLSNFAEMAEMKGTYALITLRVKPKARSEMRVDLSQSEDDVSDFGGWQGLVDRINNIAEEMAKLPGTEKLTRAVEGLTAETVKGRLEELGQLIYRLGLEKMREAQVRVMALQTPRAGADLKKVKTIREASLQNIKTFASVAGTGIRILDNYYLKNKEYAKMLELNLLAMNQLRGDEDWTNVRRGVLVDITEVLGKPQLTRILIERMLASNLVDEIRAHMVKKYAEFMRLNFLPLSPAQINYIITRLEQVMAPILAGSLDVEKDLLTDLYSELAAYSMMRSGAGDLIKAKAYLTAARAVNPEHGNLVKLEIAVNARLGNEALRRGAAEEAEPFFQAMEAAQTFYSGVVFERLELSEKAKEMWKKFYANSLKAARMDYAGAAAGIQEMLADEYFREPNNINMETLIYSNFELSGILKQLGREDEAVQAALQMVHYASVVSPDSLLFRVMKNIFITSDPSYAESFLDLGLKVFNDPARWPEPETLRQLMFFLTGFNKLGVGPAARMLLNVVDQKLLEAETAGPAVLPSTQWGHLHALLMGIHEVSPIGARRAAQSLIQKSRTKDPLLAEQVKEFLMHESTEFAAGLAKQPEKMDDLVDLMLLIGSKNLDESLWDQMRVKFRNYADAAIVREDMSPGAAFSTLEAVSERLRRRLQREVGQKVLSANFFTFAMDTVSDYLQYLEKSAEQGDETDRNKFIEYAGRLNQQLPEFIRRHAEDLKGFDPEGNNLVLHLGIAEIADRLGKILSEDASDHPDDRKKLKTAEEARNNRNTVYRRLFELLKRVKEAEEARTHKGPGRVAELIPESLNAMQKYLALLIDQEKWTEASEVADVLVSEINGDFARAGAAGTAVADRHRIYDDLFKAFDNAPGTVWLYALRQKPELLQVLLKMLHTAMDDETFWDVEDKNKAVAMLSLALGDQGLFLQTARYVLDHVDYAAGNNSNAQLYQGVDILSGLYYSLKTSGASDPVTMNLALEKAKAVIALYEPRIPEKDKEDLGIPLQATKAVLELMQDRAEEAVALLESAKAEAQLVLSKRLLDLHLVLALRMAGRPAEALAAARATLSLPDEKKKGADQTLSGNIRIFASTLLTLPPAYQEEIAQGYRDLMLEGEPLNPSQLEEVLWILAKLDSQKTEEVFFSHLNRIASGEKTFQITRDLAALNWLGANMGEKWQVYNLAEQLIRRAGQDKPAVSALSKVRGALKDRMKAPDFLKVAGIEMAAGNYNVVLQNVEDGLRKIPKSPDAQEQEAQTKLEAMRKRVIQIRDKVQQLSKAYEARNFGQVDFFILGLRELGADSEAIVIRIQENVAHLRRIQKIAAEQGDLTRVLEELRAIPETNRDALIKKTLKATEDMLKNIQEIAADLAKKNYQKAETRLTAVLEQYKSESGFDVSQETGRVRDLLEEIKTQKQAVERLRAVIQVNGSLKDMYESALELASYPEQRTETNKLLMGKAHEAFQKAGTVIKDGPAVVQVTRTGGRREPLVVDLAKATPAQQRERQLLYRKAFHTARLVYEISAAYPAALEDLLKAQEIMSHAAANLWLPKFVDDTFIVSTMAQAEQNRFERETRAFRAHELPADFPFPFSSLEIGKDRFTVKNFKVDFAAADLDQMILPGDTFTMKHPNDSEEMPILFHVIESKDGQVIFELPKVYAGREEILKDLNRIRTTGQGVMRRMRDTSWDRQRRTLTDMVKKLLETTRTQIDLTAPSLRATTGRNLADSALGIFLDIPQPGLLDERQRQDARNAAWLSQVEEAERQKKETAGIMDWSLDPPQRSAILDALNTRQPVVYVQGPGGTGKTSGVIVPVTRMLYDSNDGVMISAHQNNALDNAGVRLDSDILFARVGNSDEAIMEEKMREIWGKKKQLLKQMSERQAAQKPGLLGAPAPAAGKKEVTKKGVVLLGTVNGALNDADLRRYPQLTEAVKVLIVDEASRATLSELLRLIHDMPKVEKVLFVGDHNQLPAYGVGDAEMEIATKELGRTTPVAVALGAVKLAPRKIQDEVFEAERVDNFKISLLEDALALFFTGDAQDDAIFNVTRPGFHFLNIQRRSASRIVEINNYHYEGRLVPGRAEAGVVIEDNTEGRALEVRDGGRFTGRNPGEVDRAVNWINRLMNGDVDRRLEDGRVIREKLEAKDIAVITPYNNQIDLIQSALYDLAEIHEIAFGIQAGTTPSTQDLVARVINILTAQPGTKGYSGMVRRRFANEGQLSQMVAEFRPGLTQANVTKLLKLLGLGPEFLKVEDLDKGTINIITADSSIGHEYKAVIHSWVRANREGAMGFLGKLKGENREKTGGWKRRNVQTGRPQDYEIWIWDRATFQRAEPGSEIVRWTAHVVEKFQKFREEDAALAKPQKRPDRKKRSEMRLIPSAGFSRAELHDVAETLAAGREFSPDLAQKIALSAQERWDSLRGELESLGADREFVDLYLNRRVNGQDLSDLYKKVPDYDQRTAAFLQATLDGFGGFVRAHFQSENPSPLHFAFVMPFSSRSEIQNWWLGLLSQIDGLSKQEAYKGKISADIRILATREEMEKYPDFFSKLAETGQGSAIELNNQAPATVNQFLSLPQNANALAYAMPEQTKRQIRDKKRMVDLGEGIFWEQAFAVTTLINFKTAQVDSITDSLLRQIPDALPPGMVRYDQGLVIAEAARELVLEAQVSRLIATMA